MDISGIVRFRLSVFRLWQVIAVMFLLCLFSGNPACAAPKTVLVLGDSLSAGYGLEKGSGWVDLLEKRLKKDYPETAVVRGKSGETRRLPEHKTSAIRRSMTRADRNPNPGG